MSWMIEVEGDASSSSLSKAFADGRRDFILDAGARLTLKETDHVTKSLANQSKFSIQS